MTSLGASAQFNWLLNGDFEASDKTLERVTSYKEAAAGDWAVYAQSGMDAFVATLKQDDDVHKNVVEVAVAGSVSWYKAYLMQTAKYALKPEQFKLVFDAKNVSGNANISTLVYVGAGYALKTGFDEVATPGASGARYDFTATSAWQTFEAPFDFSMMCNNINSPKSAANWAKSEATSNDLADVRVIFNTNAKAGTFMIDNVRLVPVNAETVPDGVDPVEPDPDPETPEVPADPEFPAYVPVTYDGNYLEDGGFNIDAIQTWRTLNKGKFLGDLGHWYFYNEPKDGVDPYASTAEVVDAGDSHGKVVALVNKSPISSWWAHNLVQRVGVKMQPMTYRVSFYVRSNSGATGKVHLALKEKNAEKGTGYALLDGFVAADHPKSSGTTPDFKATTNWQMMEYVFDLSKMANTIWSPTSGTKTDEEAAAGIANYIQDVTNEELWENVYLCIWNETANSTLEIDDVVIEPIDAFMEIQNPSFETNNLLPIIVNVAPETVGARSGQWVVVNKNQGEMNLSIDDATAFDGKRSMKLETVKAARYPRMDQYMFMDLYELPEGTYSFDFAAKASKEGAPIRLDVYVYYDEKSFQAVTGENGDIYEEDTNTGHGLKVFNATTEWAKYSQEMEIAENMVVRFIIRPNIKGTNNTGLPADYELPVTHWFDNFAVTKKGTTDVAINEVAKDAVKVSALDNAIEIEGTAANVAIYTVNGVLVNSIANVNGTATCAVASGFYLVKVESAAGVQTVKVLVK